MQKEYEGRTEQEAIDKAIRELGLDRDQFDVEILEKEKKGLFRKGNVKIRVYYGEASDEREEEPVEEEEISKEVKEDHNPEPQNDNERKILEFLDTLISKMGYT